MKTWRMRVLMTLPFTNLVKFTSTQNGHRGTRGTTRKLVKIVIFIKTVPSCM